MIDEQTQTAITFGSPHTENEYPRSLTFKITAESSAGEIESATLFYSGLDARSTTRQVVEVDPASRVDLAYIWDTSQVTIPPSATIIYHWEVVDSSGNRSSSAEETVIYDDVRFEWNILEDENIAVWTHGRPSTFGERVYEIAQEAFKQQREMFSFDLENQIRIIIYNDFDEFAEWHSYVSEFTGGQAFPTIGVTTQIVSAYSSIELWLNDVIPHEISHLYFYQATEHPAVNPPAWLNEGLAQFNQFSLGSGTIDLAEREIGRGGLLPLWGLTGSFGYDEVEVHLAYAESLSVAAFISERYQNAGISKLLAAYKSGLSNDEALVEGLGVTLIELQSEWLASMGVDSDMYPTPTALPTIAWPTPPSYSTPTKPPSTNTATPDLVLTPERTVEPSAQKEVAGVEIVVEITRTKPPSLQDKAPENSEDLTTNSPRQEQGGSPICGLIAAPLILAAFITFKSRYSGIA